MVGGGSGQAGGVKLMEARLRRAMILFGHGWLLPLFFGVALSLICGYYTRKFGRCQILNKINHEGTKEKKVKK